MPPHAGNVEQIAWLDLGDHQRRATEARVVREIRRFGVDRAVVGDAGAEGVAVHHPRQLAIEEEELLMSDNLRVQVVRQVAVQCTLHVGTSEPEARA